MNWFFSSIFKRLADRVNLQNKFKDVFLNVWFLFIWNTDQNATELPRESKLFSQLHLNTFKGMFGGSLNSIYNLFLLKTRAQAVH